MRDRELPGARYIAEKLHEDGALLLLGEVAILDAINLGNGQSAVQRETTIEIRVSLVQQRDLTGW